MSGGFFVLFLFMAVRELLQLGGVLAEPEDWWDRVGVFFLYGEAFLSGLFLGELLKEALDGRE